MKLSAKHVCAVAAIAVLALIGPAAADAPAKTATGYLRIQASEKCAVYLQFQGDEVRAATSIAGLKTAEPVKMAGAGNADKTPTFALPIPKDELPTGVTGVTGNFERIRGDNRVMAHLGISRPDEQKVAWQYEVQTMAWLRFTAESAAAIAVPNLSKLTLDVTAKPSAGKLAAGVKLLAGTGELSGVLKDGKPVELQVKIVDEEGAEKASKSGPLSDFGFS